MLLASAAWDLLFSLLPFVLLLGFWVYIANRTRGKGPPGQEQLIDKLEEIREELDRIRRAIESRS